MENTTNRMEKQKNRTNMTVAEAAPIALPSKVSPHICPKCGKGQSPVVLRTFPTQGYAHVRCTSCSAKLDYHFAKEAGGMPVIRYER